MFGVLCLCVLLSFLFIDLLLLFGLFLFLLLLLLFSCVFMYVPFVFCCLLFVVAVICCFVLYVVLFLVLGFCFRIFWSFTHTYHGGATQCMSTSCEQRYRINRGQNQGPKAGAKGGQDIDRIVR